jgi:hypothetical protein
MTKEDTQSIAGLGRALGEGARLELRSLCVFESHEAPSGSQPFGSVDRCLAKAVYLCAKGEQGTMHIGPDASSGVCPGGLVWTGLAEMAEGLKYFISTGSPSFRHGEAEHLKRDPDMVVASRTRVGRIRAPMRYLCVTPCHEFKEGMGTPKAILLFAGAEQARNLLALQHFGTPEVFTSTGAPWGPSCASFLSYPAGLTTNCPDHMMIIGPLDPTGNHWLPPGTLSLGIPLPVARRMVEDLPRSFLVKRAAVAFPRRS